MRRLHFALSTLILLFGCLIILWLTQLDTVTPTQASESHEESSESKHSSHKKGLHGGVMLGHDQAVQLELTTETNAADQMTFAFYGYKNGQPVVLEPEDLKVQWQRLKDKNLMPLEKIEGGLQASTVIGEPHSFKFLMEWRFLDKSYRYAWENWEYRVTLNPEQRRANGLTFDTVDQHVLSQELLLPGKIAVDQDREAHVSPRVSGVVQEVYKHLGDQVKKGELLARLNSRELGSLKKSFQLQETRYTQAKQRYALEKEFRQNTQRLLAALEAKKPLTEVHQTVLKTPIGNDRERLVTAYTALDLAEKNYARERNLYKEKATTEVDLQGAKKSYLDNRARYRGLIEEIDRQRQLQVLDKKFALEQIEPALNMARNQLSVLGLKAGDSSTNYDMRSPINGVMISKHIAPGESVMAQEKAFSLADLSGVWAEMMIPESQLEDVKVGVPVRVESQNGSFNQSGYVTHLGSVVNEDSRTAEAHAEIKNTSGFWKPGMFVTLRLKTRQVPVSMAVQPSAIQYLNEEPFVFVRAGENEIQGFSVEIGRETREWVEIKTGLSPGQMYVSKNTYIIKAELEKSSASHDH